MAWADTSGPRAEQGAGTGSPPQGIIATKISQNFDEGENRKYVMDGLRVYHTKAKYRDVLKKVIRSMKDRAMKR